MSIEKRADMDEFWEFHAQVPNLPHHTVIQLLQFISYCRILSPPCQQNMPNPRKCFHIQIPIRNRTARVDTGQLKRLTRQASETSCCRALRISDVTCSLYSFKWASLDSDNLDNCQNNKANLIQFVKLHSINGVKIEPKSQNCNAQCPLNMKGHRVRVHCNAQPPAQASLAQSKQPGN